MAGGAAAGAQAGAAFGPWGSAFGGAAGLAGDIAGSGGPISSGLNLQDAMWKLDGANWNVSIPVVAASPGATVTPGGGAAASPLMLGVLALGALWLLH